MVFWAQVDGHFYESERPRVKKVDGSKSRKLDGPKKSGRSKSIKMDCLKVWKRTVQKYRVWKWRFTTTVLVLQKRQKIFGFKNLKKRIHLNLFKYATKQVKEWLMWYDSYQVMLRHHYVIIWRSHTVIYNCINNFFVVVTNDNIIFYVKILEWPLRNRSVIYIDDSKQYITRHGDDLQRNRLSIDLWTWLS